MNRLHRKTAFLFDLDGTLVDSNAMHERMFREVLRDDAPQFLDGFDYEPLKGKPTVSAFRALGITDGGMLDALVAGKQQRYRAAVLAGELELMAGARELLELLFSRRARLFVITGGSRQSVDAALYATGIRHFFEGVITASDVTCGKPSPEGYLLCVQKFGIASEGAVVIEDSMDGLRAGEAAGLEVVLVNSPGFPSLVEYRRTILHQAELVDA
jgi:HAD superfamily hydrolase (TIGR01509 family)